MDIGVLVGGYRGQVNHRGGRWIHIGARWVDIGVRWVDIAVGHRGRWAEIVSGGWSRGGGVRKGRCGDVAGGGDGRGWGEVGESRCANQ